MGFISLQLLSLLSRLGCWEPLQVGWLLSCLTRLWWLLFGISRCPKLLLYIFCPKLGISYFCKKPWVSRVFYPSPMYKGSPTTSCSSGSIISAKMVTPFLSAGPQTRGMQSALVAAGAYSSMHRDLKNVVLCPLERVCSLWRSVLPTPQNPELQKQEAQCPTVGPWK